jgi:hypothetical protein
MLDFCESIARWAVPATVVGVALRNVSDELTIVDYDGPPACGCMIFVIPHIDDGPRPARPCVDIGDFLTVSAPVKTGKE